MAEHSSGAFRTSIGGQALIEGILMRGPEKQAIVVRDKDGQLVEKVEELKLIKDRYPILGIPLIRGTVNFLAAMVSGVKALMYSADFYPEEEESQPSKFEQWLEKHLSSEKLEKAIVGLAVLLGVGMSIFLFLVLPTLLTGGILHFFPGFPLWGRNVVEGLLKIAIFLAYLILCSKQKDVRRVFCYHGAEHKTIFCYEAGLPLTVENARIQPKHHPRCGTSFLFVVIIVSILCSSIVFSYVNWQNIWVRIGMHLLLLIPVATRACAGLAVLKLRPMGTSQYAAMGRHGGYAAALAVLLAAAIAVPLVTDRSFAPLAAAAGYGLAVWYGFRQLDGMNGDISGFALTLGELAGAAVWTLVR